MIQRRARMDGYVAGTSKQSTELHYRFAGIAMGDLSNDGTSNVDYVSSIWMHTFSSTSHGPFRDGTNNATGIADFDQSYDPINGLTYESTASHYTVMAGDTLESVALAVWGDASLWFKIADANGLFGNETLVAGTQLVIPNKVHNFHNTSDVYRVYDPNDAIGDTSPTRAKPPKDPKGCGGFGAFIVAVISIAVAVALPGIGAAISPALGAFFETTVGGMVAAAVGSAVGQGIGVATGAISRFDWGAVAMSAISAGVSAGVGDVIKGTDIFSSIARGAISSAATQGIGMALGLQKRFDWAGVAAAGISAGVSHAVGQGLNPGAYDADGNLTGKLTGAQRFASGMVGALANATVRTAIGGGDFGDNLLAALPDVIGQTIGNAISKEIDGEPAAEFQSDGHLTGTSPGMNISYGIPVGVPSGEVLMAANLPAGVHLDFSLPSVGFGQKEWEDESISKYVPPLEIFETVTVEADRYESDRDLEYWAFPPDPKLLAPPQPRTVVPRVASPRGIAPPRIPLPAIGVAGGAGGLLFAGVGIEVLGGAAITYVGISRTVGLYEHYLNGKPITPFLHIPFEMPTELIRHPNPLVGIEIRNREEADIANRMAAAGANSAAIQSAINFLRRGGVAGAYGDGPLKTTTLGRLVSAATINPESKMVVLGRWQDGNIRYTEVAAHFEATYFKMDNRVFGSLWPDQQWQVNREFLRQQLAAGKEIVFSHDPNAAPKGSMFAREVSIVKAFYGPGTSFEKHGWYWTIRR